MNVNVIGRTDQCWFTKVRAARKERVEGLEIGVVRIVISAGDVRFQSQSRFERSLKGETDVRRSCPRLNVATAEAAELTHEFQIVVPSGFPSPNPRADGVTQFVGCALIEARLLPIQTQVVEVNLPSGQPRTRGDGVESPEILI